MSKNEFLATLLEFTNGLQDLKPPELWEIFSKDGSWTVESEAILRDIVQTWKLKIGKVEDPARFSLKSGCDLG